MSYIYNSISFEIYTIICIALIPCGFYSAWITEKRTPGHPGKYLCIAMCFVAPVLWLARYVDECSTNEILSDILDIVALIVMILFFIGIFVSLYFANKYGYTDQSKMKIIIPLLKFCAIIFMFCVVGILVLSYI